MKALFVCALAVALGSGIPGAHAKSLKDDTGPAEVPPASFQGYQYVDSTGCAYIRTGYGGATTWVPRVDRSRRVTCGLPPSLPQASRSAAQARQPVVSAKRPVQPAASVAAPRPEPVTRQRLPQGYQSAWTDGRLNDMRGVGTAQGEQQMLQVWTNTVPRRLITAD
ncbi:MAG: hypothetical protein JXR14_02040 [Paracoccaceae bacterium]